MEGRKVIGVTEGFLRKRIRVRQVDEVDGQILGASRSNLER